jgi:phosphoesterase RecJ-like protein
VTEAPIAEIRQRLLAGRRVLVATHIDPDGDAIGTQLAFGNYLRDAGQETILLRDSEIPRKYGFLAGISDIRTVADYDGEKTFDVALILECPSRKRLGRVAELIDSDSVIINIDHHLNGDLFGVVNWVDEKASSVGEMAWRYFRQVGYPLSPVVAEQLFTAVLTDTGRFRYDSTTPEAMACAGDLIAAGANPQKICDEVYFNIDPTAMKLTGKVLSTIEFCDQGRICLLTMTKKMVEETQANHSDSEGLVDYTLFNRGVTAGALLREINETRTRVSLRSARPIDVARVAVAAGGGGHAQAAGCTLALGLEKSRERVIEMLREAVADGNH